MSHRSIILIGGAVGAFLILKSKQAGAAPKVAKPASGSGGGGGGGSTSSSRPTSPTSTALAAQRQTAQPPTTVTRPQVAQVLGGIGGLLAGIGGLAKTLGAGAQQQKPAGGGGPSASSGPGGVTPGGSATGSVWGPGGLFTGVQNVSGNAPGGLLASTDLSSAGQYIPEATVPSGESSGLLDWAFEGGSLLPDDNGNDSGWWSADAGPFDSAPATDTDFGGAINAGAADGQDSGGFENTWNDMYDSTAGNADDLSQFGFGDTSSGDYSEYL